MEDYLKNLESHYSKEVQLYESSPAGLQKTWTKHGSDDFLLSTTNLWDLFVDEFPIE